MQSLKKQNNLDAPWYQTFDSTDKKFVEHPAWFGPKNQIGPTVGPQLFHTNPIKILIFLSQYIC